MGYLRFAIAEHGMEARVRARVEVEINASFLNLGKFYRAPSSAAGSELSPKVLLRCAKRSMFPGPNIKLPPS
jgi:hypothetical protein